MDQIQGTVRLRVSFTPDAFTHIAKHVKKIPGKEQGVKAVETHAK